ncbi:MAG: DUF6916 family protein [Candidatus Rokuibacteriota bacterium]
MLDALTHESFLPHVGTDFHVRLGPAAALRLTLIETAVTGPAPGGGGSPSPSRRLPFSVLFRAERGPVLPQRIYWLEHEVMGPLEIFIVPIGHDAEGMRYQAVFT